MKTGKLISNIAITYFIIGILFAIGFAVYYHWTPLALLSPGFYVVAFTWPYQAIGFTRDLIYYGLSGKPI